MVVQLLRRIRLALSPARIQAAFAGLLIGVVNFYAATDLIGLLFVCLMVIPFFSAASTLYLARLVRHAVTPPVLLVLLTIEATVSLLCSSYIAVLTVNARYFGNPNPPELLPVTLVALISPLAMINVIAFTLRRVRGHK